MRCCCTIGENSNLPSCLFNSIVVDILRPYTRRRIRVSLTRRKAKFGDGLSRIPRDEYKRMLSFSISKKKTSRKVNLLLFGGFAGSVDVWFHSQRFLPSYHASKWKNRRKVFLCVFPPLLSVSYFPFVYFLTCVCITDIFINIKI